MRRFYHRTHLASTPTTLPYLNLLRARELRRGAVHIKLVNRALKHRPVPRVDDDVSMARFDPAAEDCEDEALT